MWTFDFNLMGPDNRVLFYKRAYRLKVRFWLDKLDCSVSWRRQIVKDATFDDAMQYHNDSVIPSFILRDSNSIGLLEKPYYEVGFCNMRDGGPSWYLYILVDQFDGGGELVKFFELLGGKKRRL